MSDIEKTVKFIEDFEASMRAADHMRTIDNRQLLWLLEKIFFQHADAPIFSYTQAVIGETEDRLYPEYDGDKVTITDWGWRTPEGDIVYDRKAYEAEKKR